jgi:hypothetical protein
MENKTKDLIKIVLNRFLIALVFVVFFIIIAILILAGLHVQGLKLLKPDVKFYLPIVLIALTVFVALVVAKIFANSFDRWINWNILKKSSVRNNPDGWCHNRWAIRTSCHCVSISTTILIGRN